MVQNCTNFKVGLCHVGNAPKTKNLIDVLQHYMKSIKATNYSSFYFYQKPILEKKVMLHV